MDLRDTIIILSILLLLIIGTLLEFGWSQGVHNTKVPLYLHYSGGSHIMQYILLLYNFILIFSNLLVYSLVFITYFVT